MTGAAFEDFAPRVERPYGASSGPILGRRYPLTARAEGRRVALWILEGPTFAAFSLVSITTGRMAAASFAWGYDELLVAYLFNAFGRGKTLGADTYLLGQLASAALRVAAWGGEHAAAMHKRAAEVCRWSIQDRRPLVCLGVNGDGSPAAAWRAFAGCPHSVYPRTMPALRVVQ